RAVAGGIVLARVRPRRDHRLAAGPGPEPGLARAPAAAADCGCGMSQHTPGSDPEPAPAPAPTPARAPASGPIVRYQREFVRRRKRLVIPRRDPASLDAEAIYTQPLVAAFFGVSQE